MNLIRKTCLAAGAAAALLVPSSAYAKLNLLVEVHPGGALFSPRMSGFSVSKAGLTDSISGSASYAPLQRLGVGIETPTGSVDLTLGGGLVLNEGIYASLLAGDAAWRFKIGKTASLAPHIGVVGFMPRWLGLGHSESPDVHIENGVGALPGLTFAVGKMIGFTASADYFMMKPLKVTTANGWVANRNTIDMSGFLLQVGVAFRFFASPSQP